MYIVDYLEIPEPEIISTASAYGLVVLLISQQIVVACFYHKFIVVLFSNCFKNATWISFSHKIYCWLVFGVCPTKSKYLCGVLVSASLNFLVDYGLLFMT